MYSREELSVAMLAAKASDGWLRSPPNENCEKTMSVVLVRIYET